jgi:hypothetical protein
MKPQFVICFVNYRCAQTGQVKPRLLKDTKDEKVALVTASGPYSYETAQNFMDKRAAEGEGNLCKWVMVEESELSKYPISQMTRTTKLV